MWRSDGSTREPSCRALRDRVETAVQYPVQVDPLQTHTTNIETFRSTTSQARMGIEIGACMRLKRTHKTPAHFDTKFARTMNS